MWNVNKRILFTKKKLKQIETNWMYADGCGGMEFLSISLTEKLSFSKEDQQQ